MADRSGTGTVTAARDGAMRVAVDKAGTATAVTTVDTIVEEVGVVTSQLPRLTLQPTTVDPVRDTAPLASLTTPPTPGHQILKGDSHGQGAKGGSRGKAARQEGDLSDPNQETQELAIIPTTEIKHV